MGWLLCMKTISLLQQLFEDATDPLSGPVDFRHTYTDMSQQEVILPDKTKVNQLKYLYLFDNDPDQGGPDLGPNCLQRLSTDGRSCR